jgi:NAD(P)-dependent dehydrogenase (short-subunit alcohol dehydrogenase family)
MSFPEAFRLDGRVALLTGSGRGIGLAIGRLFARAGATVVLQDIENEVASAEASRIVDAGGRALAVGGDITSMTDVQSLVPKALELAGSLHILVNNAAIQDRRDFFEWTPEQTSRILNANLLSMLTLCQKAVPEMKRSGYGRIINLGSVQGRRGVAEMIPYSMSKAATHNFTTGLAGRVARDGITVNTISPGWFNTHRNRDDFVDLDKARENSKRWVPLGRFGEPEDCAGIALLLASPAGSYITGQNFYVDGGAAMGA